MSVFLLILKIIGIVLLSVVGFFLTVLLLVLFIPVRYKLIGKYDSTDYGFNAGFSWLLGFLRGKCIYKKEDGLDIYVKILFFNLYPKNRKHKIKNRRKNAAKVSDTENELPYSEDDTEKNKNNNSDESIITTDFFNDITNDTCSLNEGLHDKEKNKKSIHSLLKNIIEAVKKVKYTIKSVYDKIIETVIRFKDVTFDKKRWIEEKVALFSGEDNKAAIKRLVSELKNILKHIRPRKGYGYIRFGFSDPSLTGQLLAVYSIFYPQIGTVIKVTPEFEKEILETNFKVKGRIILFVIVVSGLKILLDKKLMAFKDKLLS